MEWQKMIFEGWSLLTSMIGKKVQLVGDDLFVTNSKRLEEGIKKKYSKFSFN